MCEGSVFIAHVSTPSVIIERVLVLIGERPIHQGEDDLVSDESPDRAPCLRSSDIVIKPIGTQSVLSWKVFGSRHFHRDLRVSQNDQEKGFLGIY
jgi:hypothetical protein